MFGLNFFDEQCMIRDFNGDYYALLHFSLNWFPKHVKKNDFDHEHKINIFD